MDTLSKLQLPNNCREAQEILTRELQDITQGSMMPNITVDMVGMPTIEKVRILRPSDEARRHRKRDLITSKEYRRGETQQGETKHKYSKIFYDPFAVDIYQGKRKKVEWVEGETGEVMVTVLNPLQVKMDVQSISLIVEGVSYEAYSQSFVIPPQSRRTVMLGLKPLASGQLIVKGCKIKIFNLSCIHPININGGAVLTWSPNQNPRCR